MFGCCRNSAQAYDNQIKAVILGSKGDQVKNIVVYMNKKVILNLER